MSGLKETFIKRDTYIYLVERTNNAKIRPEQRSKKAERCWENLWNEIQLKGPQDSNRHKNRITRSGQAQLVYVKNINHSIPTTWRWARGGDCEQSNIAKISWWHKYHTKDDEVEFVVFHSPSTEKVNNNNNKIIKSQVKVLFIAHVTSCVLRGLWKMHLNELRRQKWAKQTSQQQIKHIKAILWPSFRRKR